MFLLIIQVSFAQTTVRTVDFLDDDALSPELMPSGRGLAMGGAFMAKVEDETSPFYNPAGLGSFRSWSFHLSNLYAESNSGLAQELSSDTSTTSDDFQDSFDIDGLRKLHLRSKGTYSHTRIAAAPNITTRFFSAGYLYSRRTKGFLSSINDSQFEYADRIDEGPYGSFTMSMFGGIIKLGGTMVWLHRKERIGTADQATELVIPGSSVGSGKMGYVIGGTKITLPIAWLPTLSATLHNATGDDFHKDQDADQGPENVKQNLVTGFSVTPQLGKRVRLHLEVNYKDTTKEYGELENSRRLAAGMELDFMRVIFFRGGYADGLASGGLGVRVRKFRMDLSTYAYKVTTTDFEDKEDRRFTLTLSGGF